MALLHGPAGRLTAKNDIFRPGQCKEPMTHSVLETRGHMRRELLLLDMPVLTARARAGGVPEDRIRAALTTPPVPATGLATYPPSPDCSPSL